MSGDSGVGPQGVTELEMVLEAVKGVLDAVVVTARRLTMRRTDGLPMKTPYLSVLAQTTQWAQD
jgi:hypothetical protein